VAERGKPLEKSSLGDYAYVHTCISTMFPDPIAPENSGQLLSEATSELHEGGSDAGVISEDYGSAETGPESPHQDQVLESVRGGAEAEIGHSVISVIAGTDGFGSSSNSSFPEMIAAPSTEPSTNADAVPVPMVRKRGRPRKNPLAVKVPPAQRVTSYAAPSDGVKKTTVSFYATDQERVDYILDTLLETRRHRGGFSDAIKIALRLCPTDPAAISQIWDEVRAGDKRTQRPKRK